MKIILNKLGKPRLKNLSFSVPITVTREGKHFIVYTPALDLSSHGESLSEAYKNFSEVVKIFLEEIVEEGTFLELLAAYGWRVNMSKNEVLPPVTIEQRMQEVRVGS